MVLPGSRADDGTPDRARRRFLPAHLGGYAYLVVMLLCGIGLWVVVAGEWRTGVRWIAAALLGGGTARLVLPAGQAGMLGVRNRFTDASLLLAVGAALLLLAEDIPEQPGA
ncbi:DUF3017 domain-containing protein [Nocardioides sp. CPCC 205120]|uniref:DUF3017 domain-containing protein n=1 Tax=Nocardioides sp. CPCC 205120 TaxID=3406462 RepID=UPI003B50C006